jgi:hypothetical protein
MAKKAIAKDAATERVELMDKAQDAAQAELELLLKKHWPAAFQGFVEAYENHPAASRKAFKHTIGLTLELKYKGSDLAVKAEINYGARHKKKSDGRTVSMDPEFDLGAKLTTERRMTCSRSR